MTTMQINRFEDIIVWKKSMALAVSIYKQFQPCKDYSFRDQICRASVSISNNIAEGFERKTNKEFKQFLFIAKGSCAEVRSMIHLACSLEYISNERYTSLHNDAEEISRILSGFIKTL